MAELVSVGSGEQAVKLFKYVKSAISYPGKLDWYTTGNDAYWRFRYKVERMYR